MGWPGAEVDIIYIDERLFRSDRGPQINFFVKIERGQKMMGKHCIRVLSKIFKQPVIDFFEVRGSLFFTVHTSYCGLQIIFQPPFKIRLFNQQIKKYEQSSFCFVIVPTF